MNSQRSVVFSLRGLLHGPTCSPLLVARLKSCPANVGVIVARVTLANLSHVG